MIHPAYIKDPVVIEQSAKEEAKRLNISRKNIPYFVIGHFCRVTQSLQDEIKKTEVKVKEEYEWSKQEHSEDEKEFMKGYAHALEILSISLDIDL